MKLVVLFIVLLLASILVGCGGVEKSKIELNVKKIPGYEKTILLLFGGNFILPQNTIIRESYPDMNDKNRITCYAIVVFSTKDKEIYVALFNDDGYITKTEKLDKP